MLNSGTDFANIKKETIIQVINKARSYNNVVSNPALSVLNKEDLTKACDAYISLNSGFSNPFYTFAPETQADIIKLALKLSPEERKYFDFIVKNKSYKKLIDKTIKKPELLSEIKKNQTRINKVIPESQSAIYKKNVVDQLAFMKTYF